VSIEPGAVQSKQARHRESNFNSLAISINYGTSIAPELAPWSFRQRLITGAYPWNPEGIVPCTCQTPSLSVAEYGSNRAMKSGAVIVLVGAFSCIAAQIALAFAIASAALKDARGPSVNGQATFGSEDATTTLSSGDESHATTTHPIVVKQISCTMRFGI
jgi:hypothetical protein